MTEIPTKDLTAIHDAVQGAALDKLAERHGITTLDVLGATGYDDLLQAYYTAAIDRIAELEVRLNATCEVLLERGCEGVVHKCAELEAERNAAQDRIVELEYSADLYDRCYEAARGIWRKNHPGRAKLYDPSGEKAIAEMIADHSVWEKHYLTELHERNVALQERNTELEAALQPLAALADVAPAEWRNDRISWAFGTTALTWGACRKARALLPKEDIDDGD